jgi:hypothetical protein
MHGCDYRQKRQRRKKTGTQMMNYKHHLKVSFDAESALELLYNSSVSATELAPAWYQWRNMRMQGKRDILEFKVAELLDLPRDPLADFEPPTFCSQ